MKKCPLKNIIGQKRTEKDTYNNKKKQLLAKTGAFWEIKCKTPLQSTMIHSKHKHTM